MPESQYRAREVSAKTQEVIAFDHDDAEFIAQPIEPIEIHGVAIQVDRHEKPRPRMSGAELGAPVEIDQAAFVRIDENRYGARPDRAHRWGSPH